MNDESHHLTLRDLGMGEEPIVLSLWLARRGARVVAGEPLAEVLCGVATVDLPSPADGVLANKLVAEGDPLTIGQRLAVINDET
jgi:pyruvate/2-oxoglutarate dehydrogenase complex dihydrolipoamide acyltransferase (E2) component